jgi:hypothetical protein
VINVSVRNVGDAIATNVEVRIILTFPGAGIEDNITLTGLISSILPGTTEAVSIEWEPEHAKTYTLIIQIDPDDKIEEINEVTKQSETLFDYLKVTKPPKKKKPSPGFELVAVAIAMALGIFTTVAWKHCRRSRNN